MVAKTQLKVAQKSLIESRLQVSSLEKELKANKAEKLRLENEFESVLETKLSELKLYQQTEIK